MSEPNSPPARHESQVMLYEDKVDIASINLGMGSGNLPCALQSMKLPKVESARNSLRNRQPYLPRHVFRTLRRINCTFSSTGTEPAKFIDPTEKTQPPPG